VAASIGTTQVDRVEKIAECVEEINRSMKEQSQYDWCDLLWEMDLRTYLHDLLYESVL
jgi:hypothetical protein